MNSPKGGHSCIVRSCKSRSIDKNIRLFRIPRERPRAMAWLQAANRMDLRDKSSIDLYKNYKICALHFKKSMYSSPEQNRLLPTATPTEFDDNIYSCKRPLNSSSDEEDAVKKMRITAGCFLISQIDTSEIHCDEEMDPPTNNNNLTSVSKTEITSDHTYHKTLNTKVQDELDKLTSTLEDPGPAILNPVLSDPAPSITSILKSVLTAPANKPIETIDLTSQDSQPIMKCEPEQSKITQGQSSKSYLLIPKEFVKFIPGGKHQTLVLPPSLPAPQHFLQYNPEPPKKTPDSASSIPAPELYMGYAPETLKKTVDSTSSIPAPARYTIHAPETPKATVNSTSSIPAPERYMRYAPELPKISTNVTSSSPASISATKVTPDISMRTTNFHVQTQTPLSLLSTLPRMIKQTSAIKSLTSKNARLQKLLNNKSAPKPTLELFSQCCDVFLTPAMAEFVKLQAQLCKVSERGRRYNDEYKEFAEKMYSLGPRCYKYLQKLFCLPSMKSLRREKARASQNQENGEVQQQPVGSLHHVAKEIRCLPAPNIEPLQQEITAVQPVTKQINFLPEINNEKLQPEITSVQPVIQQIKCLPKSNNEKVQPVVIQKIKCLPEIENEQLQQAIKSLQPITQPITCLPDLSEL